jgi:hypothetical protein
MHYCPKLTAAGLVAVALFVAACGGESTSPGVAGAGSATTGTSSSGGSTKASALAYSRCMRSHGLSDFPDPDSKGQIQLTAGPGSDLLPDSPQFKSATQACNSLMPGPGSPAEQRRDFARALKFAQCMRSHGVQIPDPQPPGSGPKTASHSGSSGNGNGPKIDPNSPLFKRAQQACASVLPGGAGFSLHQSGAGS